jgi:hypothetical protein
MYVNGKVRHFETIPRMGEEEIKKGNKETIPGMGEEEIKKGLFKYNVLYIL